MKYNRYNIIHEIRVKERGITKDKHEKQRKIERKNKVIIDMFKRRGREGAVEA